MGAPATPPAGYELRVDYSDGQARRRLTLGGELDLASTPALTETIARLCADGTREIVLDISGLEFIDSTGLRCILAARAACERGGSELLVEPEPERVSPQVRRLLQVTGLLERLPFAPPKRDERG
jgi:anti-sigma B factor antagonist